MLLSKGGYKFSYKSCLRIAAYFHLPSVQFTALFEIILHLLISALYAY